MDPHGCATGLSLAPRPSLSGLVCGVTEAKLPSSFVYGRCTCLIWSTRRANGNKSRLRMLNAHMDNEVEVGRQLDTSLISALYVAGICLGVHLFIHSSIHSFTGLTALTPAKHRHQQWPSMTWMDSQAWVRSVFAAPGLCRCSGEIELIWRGFFPAP